MPYDEGLAQRVRELLEDDPRISEKKMFGGVAFMANGKLAAGIIKDELMVRVGPEAYNEAAAQPHARAMDFTGRAMRGFVQVAPAGFEEDADLRTWLARGIAFAATYEKKAPRAKSKHAATATRKPAAVRQTAAKPKRAWPAAKPRKK